MFKNAAEKVRKMTSKKPLTVGELISELKRHDKKLEILSMEYHGYFTQLVKNTIFLDGNFLCIEGIPYQEIEDDERFNNMDYGK